MSIRLACVCSALATFCAASVAGPLSIERDTVTTINPGAAGTFAGASFDYANTIKFDKGTGSVGYILNTLPAATGITISALGLSTVSPSSLPDGANSAPVTVTGDSTGSGGWSFHYVGQSSSTPGNSYITNMISGGMYALEFSGGGSNFVDAGNTFDSLVSIMGDFSAGTLHSAVTYGAGYSLVGDFVFNGTYTNVEVKTTSYALGVNPQIDFTLFGNTVPEPGTLALVGAALAGLVATRKRKS